MPKFEKGHKGSGGRPKGSKDHSWAKVTTWINEIKLAWPHLTANQRAHYSLELTKLLVSKLKQLPVDPTESKTNVEEAVQWLNTISSKTQPDSTDVKTG